MDITLNGAHHAVAEGTTLRGLVEQTTGTALTDEGNRADGQRLGIAVALEQAVVPRSRWNTTTLADGQAVDIVTAVQGG